MSRREKIELNMAINRLLNEKLPADGNIVLEALYSNIGSVILNAVQTDEMTLDEGIAVIMHCQAKLIATLYGNVKADEKLK